MSLRGTRQTLNAHISALGTRYFAVITAIICIGRYLKTKSNGKINSTVTRIWLTHASTHIVIINCLYRSKAKEQRNERNWVHFHLIVSNDRSDKARYWTNNGAAERKVKKWIRARARPATTTSMIIIINNMKNRRDHRMTEIKMRLNDKACGHTQPCRVSNQIDWQLSK